MRVLVTGGSGFLGSHTVRALRADGHQVRVLARTPSKARRLFDRMAIEGVEIVEGDVTDREAVELSLIHISEPTRPY